MGFYYHGMDVQFRIKAEHVPEAARRLKALGEKEYGLTFDENESHGDIITDVARETNWYVDINENGDIVNPSFDEKKGEDGNIWFDEIADLVDVGGYIEIRDDDDRTYRYVFVGDGMVSVEPIWPDVEQAKKIRAERKAEQAKYR